MVNKIIFGSFLGIFFIGLVCATVNFTSPTPDNGSSQSLNSIYVNVTSSDLYNHYVITDFDKSLLGWWTMDDTNQSVGTLGAKVYDLSSYGNNGTAKGNATQINNGKFGKGYSITGDAGGVNSIYLKNPNQAPILRNGSRFTISAWFYKLSSGQQGIYTSGYTKSTTFINYGIFTATGQYLACRIGNGTDSISVAINQESHLNAWHNVVCTFDGTVMSLYLDNVLRLNRTVSLSGVYPAHGPLTNHVECIGGGGYSCAVQQLNGSIDEVMLFNRSLSVAEISSLYNATAYQYQNNFTNLSAGGHTFKSYAVDVAGNVNSTEDRQVYVHTCLAPTSGIWVINCADNCSWNSPINSPDNITMVGVGLLSLTTTISMPHSSQIYFSPGCKIYIGSGGGFKQG